jgi:fluoride exporter
MDNFLLISIGAVLGANARYWVGDWAARKWGSAFPVGTLIINLSGSFILGFFMTFFMEKLKIDPAWRLLVATGFLGAYTTFSTYTFESLALFRKRQWAAGLFNLFGSAFAGVACAASGMLLARWL